ncbi:hypothetical protein ACNFCJ_23855 [Pseudomonas sp. NY15364]|uniref:hypothetical protein n=1 Tax=Pseudomonas sp. NY15364 TaxID=3400353 RepID=UPI003A88609C
MFDSPVNDSCPGEITVCGWPWHGRVDYTVSSDSPVLTLPNGVTTRLPWAPTPVAAYEWHQHGTLLRFRDPRAPDVERTPEQLAADAERGIEWRADVLYGPREGLVYGIGPTTRQPRSWLYHDGTMNWRVTVSAAGQLRLAQLLIVVGRTRRPDVWHSVVVDRPSGAPALTDLAVIDALPDGSRVLLARYTADDIHYGRGRASFLQGELGAWCALPREFWELRIARDETGGAHTAELLHVLTNSPFQEPVLEGEWATIDPTATAEIVGGSEQARIVDVTAVIELSELSQGQVELGFGPIGTHGVLFAEFNAETTVGAYYQPDGEIGFYTAHYGARSEVTTTITPTEVSYQGVYRFNGSGDPIGSEADRPLQSVVSIGSDTAWIELRRGGETFSRAEISGGREDSTDYEARPRRARDSTGREIQIEAGSAPGDFWAVNKSSTQHPYVCLIDGQPVDLVDWWSSAEGAWSNVGATASFFQAHRGGLRTGPLFSICRYAAAVPVISVLVMDWPNIGLPAVATRQYLGRVGTPDGFVHVGTSSRIPPFAGLYGSWNPVTGELLRDIPNPVSYL